MQELVAEQVAQTVVLPRQNAAEPARRRGIIFAVVSIALLMSSVDQTIVATALPALQHELHAQINWSSFNIGAGQTTTFNQPSSSSVIWNQINDTSASQLLGNLNANGYVVLQNPNGFYIGGQAVLQAHGLVMTTSPTPAPDLAGGGAWQFNALPPTASIINYGSLKTDGASGGSLFLISSDIENHGTITAPQGNIGLYSGKDVLVSTRSASDRIRDHR